MAQPPTVPAPAPTEPPPPRGPVGRLVARTRVLILCAYPLLGTTIAVYFTALSDQGIDVLFDALNQLSWRNDVADPTLGTGPVAVVLRAMLSGVSVVVAALSMWWPARLLVGRPFRFFPIDFAMTRRLREWLPRLLAFAVLIGVAIGYGRVAARTDWQPGAIALAAMWTAGAFALLWILKRRRAWWARLRGRTVADVRDPDPELERPRRSLVVAGVAAYVALSLAFAAWPVGLPRLFGGTALIFFGVGGLTFIATMTIAYLPLSQGSPALTAVALVYLALAATCSDNHAMRPLEAEAAALPPALTPAQRAQRWQQARAAAADCRQGGETPLLHVAAAGGGLRAGYWTAKVLEQMSADLGRDFDCSLFALSGVSGGSLGVAAYAAAGSGASRGLAADFLSPAVAGLLFYDALQRVVPYPIGWLDRSRGLEAAFEHAFAGVAGEPFRHPLRALDGRGPMTPMLFLNATIVEDGRRAIHSNVDLRGFGDVYDLGCPRLPPDSAPSTAAISLAAAVHNSARFTYVSPAGRIDRLGDGCTGFGLHDARIVDGGYFENSGAATLVQLLCAIEGCDRQPAAAPPAASASASASAAAASAPAPAPTKPRPVLLLIRNSPGTRPYCSGDRLGERCISLSADPGAGAWPTPSRLLPEITSPLQALLTVREQRERLAVVAAAEAFAARGGTVIEAYLPINEKSLPDPPLGWSLSPGVRAGLDDAARSSVARCVDALKALFAGEPNIPGCRNADEQRDMAQQATAIATQGRAAASAASAAAAPRR